MSGKSGKPSEPRSGEHDEAVRAKVAEIPILGEDPMSDVQPPKGIVEEVHVLDTWIDDAADPHDEGDSRALKAWDVVRYWVLGDDR